MPLSYFELILLNYIEGSLNTACIGAKSDFAFCKVSHNRNFSLDTTVTSESLKVLKKAVSVASKTNPVSVHKYFGLFLIKKI